VSSPHHSLSVLRRCIFFFTNSSKMCQCLIRRSRNDLSRSNFFRKLFYIFIKAIRFIQWDFDLCYDGVGEVKKNESNWQILPVA
jgi:hypothetical protein